MKSLKILARSALRGASNQDSASLRINTELHHIPHTRADHRRIIRLWRRPAKCTAL
ncbi:MAG: hypothetical protein ACE37N_12645 [Pseudohongiellaceae bacterium]